NGPLGYRQITAICVSVVRWFCDNYRTTIAQLPQNKCRSPEGVLASGRKAFGGDLKNKGGDEHNG
ncbi:MAG: hypothetical protein J5641_07105, partial [Bacteroidales bacterium]|nr:hypothetical protein [Bacteroidales bacterium]